jgi:hypothetical protein
MEYNYYTIQITGGTSVGPYTIYYTTVSPNNIAEIYPTNVPAQNISLNDMLTGVDIEVPDNTTLLIIYNQLCDTVQTFTVEPQVECVDLCITYSGQKQIQLECNGVDQNGVFKWIETPTPNCEVLWDNDNNRWYLTCPLNGDSLFSNDPSNSNPPINWFSVGGGLIDPIIATPGSCQLQSPLFLNVSVNQPDCEPDGSIILSAQGGFSPYLFSINNGLTTQSSPIFNNLGPGTYSCQVIDSSGNTENSVIVLNPLTPTITYELELQTTNAVIQSTPYLLNIEYLTTLNVTPPLPNGITITFDFTHLGIFKNSRIPGFSTLNRTIVLNKNNTPISSTSTNNNIYTEPTTPQCNTGNVTVQFTATTNNWNSISITQGDIIQVLTSSVITYQTPQNTCNFGIDNNQFTVSNTTIQGCSCCGVETIAPPLEIPTPQTCLGFLEAGQCGDIPTTMTFVTNTCGGLFPNQPCNGLVVYIPVKLNNINTGFSLEFSPLGIYDGLDVVDVCNENVLGGLGMLGSSNIPSTIVTPGTYTYTKKAFYNFNTNTFNVLSNFPDFDMTFKYPNSCINDWNPPLPIQIGTTTGYENLLSQGDPLPTINEMYLPKILVNGQNVCPLPSNGANTINFTFNRPLPPLGGYPNEETFLLRVFGHPINTGTAFTIRNITCF